MPMTWLFKERQRLRQWWAKALVAGMLLFALYGLLGQLLLDRPLGDNPADHATTLGISLLMLVLALLILTIRLDTMVDAGGLHIRFWPFMERHIALDQVAETEITAYRGVGTGIRLGSKHGTVYNLSGGEGVQLRLRSGELVFVGSRHARQLEEALRQG